MARPRTRVPRTGDIFSVSLYLDGDVILKLDAEVERMNGINSKAEVTRTDLVRSAIHEWLAKRPASMKPNDAADRSRE